MPQDCIWALRPVLVVSTALGFVVSRSVGSGQTLRRSFLGCFWTLVILGMHCTCVACVIVTELSRKKVHAEEAVHALDLMSGSFVQIVALLLFATTKVKTWDSLIRKVKFIDEFLLPSTKEVNTKIRRKVLCEIVSLVILCIVEIIVMILAYKMPAYQIVSDFMQNVTNFFFSIQFASVAFLVRDRFKIINENIELKDVRKDLANISGERKLLVIFPVDKMTDQHKMHTPKWSECVWEEKVERLQKAHALLAEACDEISSVYGIPILLELAYLWTEVMMNCYYLLVQTSRYGGDTVEIFAALIINIVRGAVAALAVCGGGDAAMQQARRTASLLGRLVGSRETPPKRVHLLDKFAQQLSTTVVEFRCCGFFNVDMQLLFAFFTAVFGYLVIMVQLSTKT